MWILPWSEELAIITVLWKFCATPGHVHIELLGSKGGRLTTGPLARGRDAQEEMKTML